MTPERQRQVLDRVLEPVTRCLNRDAIAHLLDLRADADLQSRVDELAQKANEGALSAEEAAEYDTYVSAANLISVLQAKARLLRSAPPAA